MSVILELKKEIIIRKYLMILKYVILSMRPEQWIKIFSFLPPFVMLQNFKHSIMQYTVRGYFINTKA